jgi:small subunit ribosomal protein S16
MLTIRLQRTGKKNLANFRVVVAEKAAHVSKKVHEILGSYNPHKKELVLKNPERLNYWVGQNVALSETVHNLLVDKGLIKSDKVQARRLIKKEQPKVEEAPAATAAPAPEAAAEEAPAVEEAAPAEETAAPEETKAE